MAIRKENLLGNHWGAFSLRETSVGTDGCEMPAVRKQRKLGAVGTFAWGVPWKPGIRTTNGPVFKKQNPPPCKGERRLCLAQVPSLLMAFWGLI